MPDYFLTKPPLLSIAMSIYNPGKSLGLAISSILAQTLTDWELILIDDGSSNSTTKIIDNIRDPRIRFFQDGKNKGLATRLNEAIELAQGSFFARMDQDDVAYPQRLSRQVGFLQAHPQVDLCGVRCIAIDEENQPVGLLPFAPTHMKICASPWNGFYLPHPSWCGRTAWFKAHRYSLNSPYFCEDQELLLRTYAFSHFACIDEILLAYRLYRKKKILKTIRTRVELLSVSNVMFVSSKGLASIILSVVTTFIKIIIDICDFFLCGYIRSVKFKSKSRRASPEDIRAWRSALSVVQEIAGRFASR